MDERVELLAHMAATLASAGHMTIDGVSGNAAAIAKAASALLSAVEISEERRRVQRAQELKAATEES